MLFGPLNHTPWSHFTIKVKSSEPDNIYLILVILKAHSGCVCMSEKGLLCMSLCATVTATNLCALVASPSESAMAR